MQFAPLAKRGWLGDVKPEAAAGFSLKSLALRELRDQFAESGERERERV